MHLEMQLSYLKDLQGNVRRGKLNQKFPFCQRFVTQGLRFKKKNVLCIWDVKERCVYIKEIKLGNNRRCSKHYWQNWWLTGQKGTKKAWAGNWWTKAGSFSLVINVHDILLRCLLRGIEIVSVYSNSDSTTTLGSLKLSCSYLFYLFRPAQHSKEVF